MGAVQHPPRAAPAPRGLRAPPGPCAPAPRTAAAPAPPPRPLGAWEHPSPRSPPPPIVPELRSLVPTLSLLPSPDEHRTPGTGLDTPIAAACSSPAQGRHRRPRMPARSGRASSEGRPGAARAARAASESSIACTETFPPAAGRRGREVPARRSGEAGRGGRRSPIGSPGHPRPRDNNKAPTLPGRRRGESGAEIVGNSELHFPASAARSLRYVLGTIDQMEWKGGESEPAED